MNGMPAEVLIVFLGFLAIFAFATLVVFAALLRPWLRAFLSAAPVSVLRILAMRLRGNPSNLLIDAYITLKRGGGTISIDELEIAYMDARSRVTTAEDLVELMRKRQRSA